MEFNFRSFATGISVCGSGVGTFVFAPLTQYLIQGKYLHLLYNPLNYLVTC